MSQPKNAEWMTQLESTNLIDLPLTDLAIPGRRTFSYYSLATSINHVRHVFFVYRKR